MTKRKHSKMFMGLRDSLKGALAYEQGMNVSLRVSELPPPPNKLTPREIKRIRLSLDASQAIFARALNVSKNSVASWEQGIRTPQHAALKLLLIAKKRPEVLLEL